MESDHRPLGYDPELCLSWTVLGRVDPGGDVRISSQRRRDGFELRHRGLSLSGSGPHRGLDIKVLDRVSFGLDQAVADRRAGLEDEARGADPALDVGGGVEDRRPRTGAQRVDFPGDVEVSGADDQVRLDLRVLSDRDGSGGLDRGPPVSFFDEDVSEAQATGAVGTGRGFCERAVLGVLGASVAGHLDRRG